MTEEERQRASHASHVAAVSHGSGGGHVAKGARPQAPHLGIVARAAMTPKAWDAWLEQEDAMSHPLYVNMKFPEPGPGTEYPKWVIGDGTHPDHKLANDEAEERAILANQPVESRDALKASLIAEAEARGIAIDARWGAGKLQQVILNPPG